MFKQGGLGMPIIRFYRCWLAACLVSLGGASA
ncbi:conserved hypothetical protein, partial [Bordetella bronchiseptica MO211]